MYSVSLQSGSKSHSAISNAPQNKLRLKYDKIVLLLHGFPDDNTSFNDFYPPFIANFPQEKVLTLAPLLRGYEKLSQHSDLSNSYRTADLAEDIRNFIVQNLDYENAKVHLVGHDWGAIATFKAASLYPDLFDSISTLAIPYLSNVHVWDLIWAPEQLWYSSYFLTMQFKLLYGKLSQQHSENSYLNALWEYWLPGWDYSHDDIEHVRATLQKGDTIDHVTAYYRSLFNPRHIRSARWHVDFKKVPTLLVGGRKDQCMTHRLYELEKHKLANEENARVVIVGGAGHFLHREAPEKVADIVADWINEYS